MLSKNTATKLLISLTLFTTLGVWSSGILAEEISSNTETSSTYHVPYPPKISPEVEEIIDLGKKERHITIDTFLYLEILKKVRCVMSQKMAKKLANKLDQLIVVVGPDVLAPIFSATWLNGGGSYQIDYVNDALADILKVYAEVILEQIKEK